MLNGFSERIRNPQERISIRDASRHIRKDFLIRGNQLAISEIEEAVADLYRTPGLPHSGTTWRAFRWEVSYLVSEAHINVRRYDFAPTASVPVCKDFLIRRATTSCSRDSPKCV